MNIKFEIGEGRKLFFDFYLHLRLADYNFLLLNEYDIITGIAIFSKFTEDIMKKIKILTTILVLLLVTTVFLSGCDSSGKESKESNDKPAVTEEESKDEEKNMSATNSLETQKIGSDEYGYLDVPANWVKFVDQSFDGTGVENPFIGYCNPVTTEIVNMFAVDSSVQTAEDMANRLYTNFEQQGYQELTGAKVNDTGYDCFQVYGIAPVGVIHVVWTFDDGAGKVHYISVEGGIDSAMEIFEIPKTFSLTK